MLLLNLGRRLPAPSYGGVDDPLRVVASGQAEGRHANFGCYGPGRARADPGVVMLGERYDGRGMLCCELKRARGRVVGEENNPLRAVCQHFLECQQLVALRRKDDRDVLGPPRNVPRGEGGGLRTSLSSGWLNQSTAGCCRDSGAIDSACAASNG